MIIAVLLISGLVLLFLGAELLVKGSSGVALRAGIPSLVVGLTIVAFGTSAPELVVSITAGLNGAGNISVGNVAGSNIFNIAVILGLSSLLYPLKVNLKVLKIDIPILIFISLLMLFFLLDKTILRYEAVLLVILFIIYVTFTVVQGRREQRRIEGEDETIVIDIKRPLSLDIIFIVAGLAALVFGSRLFVSGATDLARIFGISDAVIGLTIVAGGTSLPELATSVVAAVKKEEDIAIGNIVGSSIFNILGILGITGTLTPLIAEGIGLVDLSVMTALSLFLVPLMITGKRISRPEGLALLLVYAGFMWYLWP